MVQIYPLADDHRIHTMVMRRFIISPEFETLSPKIQQMAMQHLAEHMQNLASPTQAPPPQQMGMPAMPPSSEGEGIAPQQEGDMAELQALREQMMMANPAMQEMGLAGLTGTGNTSAVLTSSPEMLDITQGGVV